MMLMYISSLFYTVLILQLVVHCICNINILPAVCLCQDVLCICIYSVIWTNNFQYYMSSVIAIANLTSNMYSCECAYERNSNLSDLSVFFCVMHYSAKRSIAIACRPSVCDVGGSGPHRLEMLETYYTHN